MNSGKPIIVVHGGAKAISADKIAANQAGCRAAVKAGDGESIIPVVLAKTAVDALTGGKHPDQAAQQAIATLKDRVEGEAGCVLLDSQGRIGWAYNSPAMAVAYMADELSEPAVFTHKD